MKKPTKNKIRIILKGFVPPQEIIERLYKLAEEADQGFFKGSNGKVSLERIEWEESLVYYLRTKVGVNTIGFTKAISKLELAVLPDLINSETWFLNHLINHACISENGG